MPDMPAILPLNNINKSADKPNITPPIKAENGVNSVT
jgi:hypothetical protein